MPTPYPRKLPSCPNGSYERKKMIKRLLQEALKLGSGVILLLVLFLGLSAMFWGWILMVIFGATHIAYWGYGTWFLLGIPASFVLG